MLAVVVVLQGIALLVIGARALKLAHAQIVDVPLVVTVRINPDGISIPAGQVRLFTATVFNNGSPILPPGTVPVSWDIAPNSGVIVDSSTYTALVRATGVIGPRLNALTATTLTAIEGTASFTITPGAVQLFTV